MKSKINMFAGQIKNGAAILLCPQLIEVCGTDQEWRSHFALSPTD
jgi:hypothetical protein